MATISKFNTAFLSMPNELTVAAANFNLDFSLMKVEAPKEFHGVRDALSSHRRDEAEEGQPHTTARKLGALFEAIIPAVPDLIQAYGKRASSISSQATAETQAKPNIDLFAAQAGIDGTAIWAAATSGQAALGVHLLACMLARIWKSHEAISLWVELVERRKTDIIDTYNNNNIIETAAIMASKQTFTRQQLAQWDSSARSWLQTADVNRRVQQTQLMLIVNNVRLPVNSVKDPYESVIQAWKSAMGAMNNLVCGIPQQVQNGAILLAMSSWHLYPDMEVLVNQIAKIDQNDELMNGGLVTISAHGANREKEGVFWSLPLSRMRFYSPAVVANRHISLGTSRITMDELWTVVLGVVVSQWEQACPDIDRCFKFIIFLSDLVNKPCTTVPWLHYLSNATIRYRAAKDLDHHQAKRLLGVGMRQCASFLNPTGHDPLPFFGLTSFSTLTSIVPNIEAQINLMRRIAETLYVPNQDLIIRFPAKLPVRDLTYSFATALSSSTTARSDGEPLAKRKRQYDAREGYIRWVPAVISTTAVTCAGSNCRCVTTRGPECLCAELGLGCSLSCHPSFDALSRCDCGCGSHRVRNMSCEQEGQERQCNCRVCSIRQYVSHVESTGERCYTLEDSDVEQVDDLNFVLTSPGHNKWEYEYLLGDLNGTSLFSRRESQVARYQVDDSGSPASIDEIEWFLTNDAVSFGNLILYLKSSQQMEQNTFYDQLISLKALEFATQLYESFKDSTVDIEVVRRPLCEAAWVQDLPPPLRKITMSPFINRSPGLTYDSPDLGGGSQDVSTESSDVYEQEEQLARCFACIAMFETGEFSINPITLQGVIALSKGDSIYVATALISDPYDSPFKFPISRVMGNLGRSEIVFLTPPSSPRLQDYDLTSWNLINHRPFDGVVEDNFSATSLHLSFTDFEMPIDIGVRGLRDTLMVLVESLVSINDGGKHLGDLDVMSLFSSPNLALMQPCSHSPQATTQSTVKNLISIDSWAEFFDLPKVTGIVRAYGNWQARLAIATASTQQGKHTLLLPQKPCIECLASWGDLRRFDIIVM